MDYILKPGERPAFTGIYEEINNDKIKNYCYISNNDSILPPTKTFNGSWRWTGKRQKDYENK